MIELSGPALQKFLGESAVAKDLDSIAAKLAAKDSTLWGVAAEAEARVRLNWIGQRHLDKKF